jgi:hypothetical protein
MMKICQQYEQEQSTVIDDTATKHDGSGEADAPHHSGQKTEEANFLRMLQAKKGATTFCHILLMP